MGLFSRKKNYLGVDLGTSSVKVVELGFESGAPKLVTYGFIEESTKIVKSDSSEQKKKISLLIKNLLKKTGATTDQVVAALPSFSVFSSIISLPAMSEKDLNSAVRWEAKKFVPMPLEEMVLDWRLVEEEKKKEKSNDEDKKKKKDKKISDYKILLTAAPKNLAKKYIDIFKSLNLQIVSLETESFALQRSLIGDDPSPVMIVDIGALATDISVIKNGIPILNRGVDVGGDTITKSIANALNIDSERAEQFKRDFGISSGLSQNNNSHQNKIPKTIEFVLSSVINEIKHVFNLYKNIEDLPVEKIVLSGGSAFLPNFTEYLSKLFDTKVIIGNPWSRVSYPKELEPALMEIGPRFSVAIGLALRELI
ncbi:MAG: type IV pilus assembly protein PilM [Patescibacteria group bacterium]|nr:type IV pilus assembly protein PilM [Patescibacteria group bacterium]